MGIQNSEPDQSGYAKSFETSSTRRRAAGLAALAFAGVSVGGCSSTSAPANGNGDDSGYVAPPTGGDDGSTQNAEASTDDGGTTDDGSPGNEGSADDGSPGNEGS